MGDRKARFKRPSGLRGVTRKDWVFAQAWGDPPWELESGFLD